MLLLVWACTQAPEDPLRATSDPGTALVLARQIEDPLLRGSAVNRWVNEHKGQTPRRDLLALCEVLDHPEQGVCRRRVESAHME